MFYDFQLNTTESVVVGRNREEVLEKIQYDLEINTIYMAS
jgi:hypothetical protein